MIHTYASKLRGFPFTLRTNTVDQWSQNFEPVRCYHWPGVICNACTSNVCHQIMAVGDAMCNPPSSEALPCARYFCLFQTRFYKTGLEFPQLIFSLFVCHTGVAATCMALLVDRGQLDYDRPVASYWPEFAQEGKENITVRMLLNHEV